MKTINMNKINNNNRHKKSSSCYELSAPNLNDSYYKFTKQQIEILKNIMYPNQFQNFLKAIGIIDIQNSQEIPITKNLKLVDRLERIFNPSQYTIQNNYNKNNLYQNSSSYTFNHNTISIINNSNKLLNYNYRQKIIPKTPNFTYSYSYEDSEKNNQIPKKPKQNDRYKNYNYNNNIMTMNASQYNNTLVYDYENKKYNKIPSYYKKQIQIKNNNNNYKSKSSIPDSRKSKEINYFIKTRNKMKNKNKKSLETTTGNTLKNNKNSNNGQRSSNLPNKKNENKSIISNDMGKANNNKKNLSKNQIKKQIEKLKYNLIKGEGRKEKKFKHLSLIDTLNTIYLDKKY